MEYICELWTLEKVVEWLLGHKSETLDFTFDTDLDVEPTGWHGIKISREFDGEAIIAGYYGGGIDFALNIVGIEKREDIATLLKEMFSNVYWEYKETICVDVTEMKEECERIRCVDDISVPEDSKCARCCIYCKEECELRCHGSVIWETEENILKNCTSCVEV